VRNNHTSELLLNDFAIRSFRDTGDQDYVAARLAFRARLFPQFLWSALQALEKYLKCILVLNRIKANRGHDLASILTTFAQAQPFELRLTPSTQKFFEFLDAYGRHRYFESSWYVEGDEIIKLDRAVWEIRRYARVMSYELHNSRGNSKNLLTVEIQANVDAEKYHPQKFCISGGFLETVLDKHDHPCRAGLVWQNVFFGRSHRKAIRLPNGVQAANSPLTLHPELLEEVLKYVWLPKVVIDAYTKTNQEVRKT
jgi:HEPN domain-containing protein